MAFALLVLAGVATVSAPEDAGCAAANADEIVVCKRPTDPARYRLPAMPPIAGAGPPRAEWGLGGGTRMGVAVSSAPMAQGAISQRAMVTIKIPF